MPSGSWVHSSLGSPRRLPLKSDWPELHHRQMPNPATERRNGITIIGLEPSSFHILGWAGEAPPSLSTEGLIWLPTKEEPCVGIWVWCEVMMMGRQSRGQQFLESLMWKLNDQECTVTNTLIHYFTQHFFFSTGYILPLRLQWCPRHDPYLVVGTYILMGKMGGKKETNVIEQLQLWKVPWRKQTVLNRECGQRGAPSGGRHLNDLEGD